MKDDEKTRYVCLGCKEFMTVREVRDDKNSENLCAKCNEATLHKGDARRSDNEGKGKG